MGSCPAARRPSRYGGNSFRSTSKISRLTSSRHEGSDWLSYRGLRRSNRPCGGFASSMTRLGRVRYLVVNTSNWWLGRKVLVAPQWIERVSWTESKVQVELSLLTIKNGPEYNDSLPITRDYERRLHDYYERSAYWVAEGFSIDDMDYCGGLSRPPPYRDWRFIGRTPLPRGGVR